MTIAIVDFGMGNLRSVANAFRFIDEDCAITCDHVALTDAKALVLPGVGAFGDAMANLHERSLVPLLEREIREKGKPCLGICLGMQLFLDRSHEHGIHEGLGWISGEVRRITPADGDPTMRVPHVGWNAVRFQFVHPLSDGLSENEDYYFVHSFHCVPEEPDISLGISDYGQDIASILVKENLTGFQFHPEKSHLPGLALLKNWCRHLD